jgi:hypothetical protein
MTTGTVLAILAYYLRNFFAGSLIFLKWPVALGEQIMDKSIEIN